MAKKKIQSNYTSSKTVCSVLLHEVDIPGFEHQEANHRKKKNALHLELEWVKLAHFCHEFLLILLKIHSYINNFAIQNSGAKYKVVPSSALTGQ